MRASTAIQVFFAALALFGPCRHVLAIDVTSNANSGSGTLRQAIIDVNGGAAGPINMKITGVPTIALTQPLPAITVPVLIDATTQSGYGGTPLVEIDGAAAPASTNGFTVAANGVQIRGFSIRRFNGNGIVIAGNGNFVTACYIGLDRTGASSGNTGTGVFVTGSDNVVQTSTISANGVDGIRIDQATSQRNIVRSNRIGTDPTATAGRPNAFNGVVLNGAGQTQIGGDPPNGNIISGNGRNGVAMAGGATGNTLIRNFIGVAADGATPLGNTLNGVIVVDSPGNTIGGAAAGQFNVISANFVSGIDIRGAASTGNVVQRGLIGTNLAGNQAAGNRQYGIWLQSAQNRIGTGAVGNGGNVISGNSIGIRIAEGTPTANRIEGNYIGTDASGTFAIPNSTGIQLLVGANGTIIGSELFGNVVSGNTANGISIGAADNVTIEGNYIGTNAAGNAALGNGQEGIYVDGATNLRVGTNGEGNVIAANGADGVRIQTVASSNTEVANNSIGLDAFGAALGNAQNGVQIDGGNVAISSNRIHANGSLGIDIGTSGVQPNDPLDADTGANGQQNHPVFASATVLGGTTTLAGTLSSAPGATYRLQFYTVPSCDPSGYGEGVTSLGTLLVTTDANGNAPFSTSRTNLPSGTVFTATATLTSAQATSEFSPCITSSVPSAQIQFEVAASTQSENGGPVAIYLTRTTNTGIAASVRVDSFDESAVANADYAPIAQTVTFEPNVNSAAVFLTPIDDNVFEGNETLQLRLSQPSAGSTLGATTTHTVTLTSNELQPVLSAAACSATEGNAAAPSCDFVVSLSRPSASAVEFRTTTFANGGAIENVDFTPQSDVSRIIPAGATTATVSVPILDDLIDEGVESFTLRATARSGATGVADVTGTIVDDEPTPTLSVAGDGCTIDEGDSGTTTCIFTLELSGASSTNVTFAVATAAGTANGLDFQALSTTRFFAPGQRSLTVPITIATDSLYEFDETYTLQIRNVANATPASIDAPGTIRNDDDPPDFTVDPCVVREFDTGTTPCTFVVKTNPATPAQRPIELYWFTDSDDNRLGTAEGASAEAPAAPATLVAGQTFGPWTVESGNIDHKNFAVMQPAHYRQLIDLHGNVPGTIYADVPTQPGQQYVVSFALSGHPDCMATKISTMDAWFGAQMLGGFVFDATGNTTMNMGWRYESRVVFATATTTRLRFAATTPGSCGSHIDDIAVMPFGGASSGLDLVPTFLRPEAAMVLPPGVVQQDITVPVRGDTLYEGEQEDFTLRVCLKDGVCRTAPASIVDDDPPPSNAIFANGFE